jgi:pyruvate/2-oxoglutarate dehydrogenase complex dihydrolipoamide dehydrogenase (E3) component
VTFTDPEVGHVGLTESQARQQFGDAIHVAQWSLPQIDRAVCDDDRDGFLKLILHRDRIVGATVVAARAGEMTGELSLAITHRLTVAQIAATIHAYPTYTTAIQQLCSERATAGWVSSALGRGLTALLGYRRRKTMGEPADA